MKNYVVPKTLYHRAMNAVGLIVLIGLFSYIILFWNKIPNEVPLHYNAAGEINRWGSKGELIVLPIVLLIIYVGTSVLEHYPVIWNTGVTVTDENRDIIYTELKNLIITTKLMVVIIFTVLFIYSSTATPIPWWFLPLDLILLFGSMFFFISKIYKKSPTKDK